MYFYAFFIFILNFSMKSIAEVPYRFVCNGYLANGVQRSDTCGVCNDETAARWANPNVPVVVDSSKLPSSIPLDDWLTIINQSLQEWSNVAGSSFNFIPINSKSMRMFGGNDKLHEIFWITDEQEWRRVVGSGEFGTLGATLPRYICGGEVGSKRVIFDSDLVLNGLSYVNWQVDCTMSEDCIAVKETLVHELGHMLGLDHPCKFCTNSIMSAQAGNELIAPTGDDYKGLRTLYPSNHKSKGHFAYPCESQSDCVNDFFCMRDKGQNICTSACSKDDDCEYGAFCAKGESDLSYCAFVSSAQIPVAHIHEDCSKIDCASNLVCAGANKTNYNCFKTCEDNNDCPKNASCLSIEPEVSICVQIAHISEACNSTKFCKEGLVCLFDEYKKGICREKCSNNFLCDSNQECRNFDGLNLCVPTNQYSVGMPLNSDINLKKNAVNPWACTSTNKVSNFGHLEIFALLLFLFCVKKYRKSISKTSVRGEEAF